MSRTDDQLRKSINTTENIVPCVVPDRNVNAQILMKLSLKKTLRYDF